jgi:hypothetical protein
MRPADLVAWAALALGCARPAPATAPAVDARPTARGGPSDAAPAPGEPKFVTIESFDCAKHEVFPGEPPPKGLIPAGAGIRAWKAGGPYGANWNVDELRCAVRASTPCTRGKAALTLRVGQQIVAEREVAVTAGAADFETVIPAARWERGYDSAPRTPPFKLPFRTAVFRAQVAIDCQAPTKASLRDWRYPSVVAEETFVAGFAQGE